MPDGNTINPLSLRDLRDHPQRLSPGQRLALVRAEQRRSWSAGQCTTVEEFVQRYPALVGDTEAIIDLAYSEFVLRTEAGQKPDADDFCRRFPAHSAALRRQLTLHQALEQMTFPSVEIPTVHTAGDSSKTMDAGPPVFESMPPDAPATIVTDVAEAFQTLMQAPELVRKPDSPASVDEDEFEGVSVPGYEILSELGRGGMGVVYKARQHRLDRVVALKMILSGEFASKTDRERFRDEAVKLARVQHPNIVQIYEIGEYESRPYFAMEYLDGGSLSRELSSQPLTPRIAARLVQKLANAMFAAHEKGIVHRDLKPGNILLSASGLREASEQGASLQLSGTSLSGLDQDRGPTAKITDFGLAKGIAGEESRTATNAVLGTPSYMAPEQAKGQSKFVGPAADIYALGAILYECLTGRPPFLAPNPIDTIYLVVHEEPVKPSAWMPKLPRDLETICLKCLEKEPTKRYATAKLLAEDLEAFLENRPIQARPIGLIERAVKWAKRRPAQAALAGTITVGLIGAIVAGVVVNERLRFQRNEAIAAGEKEATARKEADDAKEIAIKAQDKAVAAANELKITNDKLSVALDDAKQKKEAAEKAQAVAQAAEADAIEKRRIAVAAQELAKANAELAEKRFQLTKKAVDTYFTQVSTNDRLDEPGMEPLRKHLLKLAGDYYADFIKEKSNNIELQIDGARAVARLAQITSLESAAESIKQFQEALKRFTTLAEANPSAAELQDDIAATHSDLAVQYRKAKMRPEAIESARTAVELWRYILFQMKPADKSRYDRARAGLARSWDAFGGAYYAVRDFDQAMHAYEEALRIRDTLASEDLDNESLLRDKAVTLDNIANLAADKRDFPNAESARNQVHQILLDLVGKNPKRAKYRNDLARNELNLGNLYLGSNPQTAAKWFREAATRWESLTAQTSDVPAYKHGTGQAYRGLGQALTRLKDERGSADALEKAQKIFKDLIRANPDSAESVEYIAELARVEYEIGERLFLFKSYADAILAYQRSIAALERLVEKNADSKVELANSLLQLAIRLRAAGRGAEAGPILIRDSELLRELMAADSTNNRIRLRAMSCGIELARAELRSQKPKEALALLDQCLALAGQFGAELRPGSPERTVVRDAHWKRAEALTALGDYEKALAAWDETIKLTDKDEAAYFRLYRNASIAKTPKYADAVQYAVENKKNVGGVGKALYHVARLYANAASAAASDANLKPDERSTKAEEYAKQAIEALREARKAGYFEDPEARADMPADPAWAAISTRPEFKNLLSELAAARGS